MRVASIGTNRLDSPVKEASGHKITQLLKAWSGGEAAAALKVSHDTVTRDWKFARSRLRHELRWESESGA